MRKLKNVLIVYIALFVTEIIVVGFIYPEVNNRGLKNNFQDYTQLPQYFMKYIEKYLKNMMTDSPQSKAVKSHSVNYRVIKIRSDGRLNVRIRAGSYNRKIGNLPFNAVNIKVVSCKNISNGEKWCNIEYDRIYGWVSAKYLQPEKTNAY